MTLFRPWIHITSLEGSDVPEGTTILDLSGFTGLTKLTGLQAGLETLDLILVRKTNKTTAH